MLSGGGATAGSAARGPERADVGLRRRERERRASRAPCHSGLRGRRCLRCGPTFVPPVPFFFFFQYRYPATPARASTTAAATTMIMMAPPPSSPSPANPGRCCWTRGRLRRGRNAVGPGVVTMTSRTASAAGRLARRHGHGGERVRCLQSGPEAPVADGSGGRPTPVRPSAPTEAASSVPWPRRRPCGDADARAVVEAPPAPAATISITSSNTPLERSRME